jgi:hypothetical protein
MTEQKEKPFLKEGQTLCICDESEWNKWLKLHIVVNGKFHEKNFTEKYLKFIHELHERDDIFKKGGAWGEVDRAPINAYAKLYEQIHSWLFDPFAIVDIDYVAVMLEDMKVLSKYIANELLSFKKKRGC